jgi:putative DNA primase/helicase
VKIDRTVHNPSRITKVAGTIAANKGDSLVGLEGMEDRPHRRARLVSVPSTITPVHRELLDALVATATPPDAPRTNPGQFPPPKEARRGGFERVASTPSSVRGYLESHGITVKNEKRSGSATVLCLDRCPVVADCTSSGDSDVAVIVGNNGVISYKNLHNRGEGLGWRDVREALEPGYKAFAESLRGRHDRDGDRSVGAAGARPRTDLGNAERLADRHGDRLLHCNETGRWLVWNGRVWAPDDSGAVVRFAADTVRSIHTTADNTPEAEAVALGRWARASESKTRLEAMIALARSIEGVAVRVEELDADPWSFNCTNGTLDLKTGKLRVHRREDLFTRLAPVAFDPEAPAPRWAAFVERIFGGDTELIRFVQQFLGMSLTGDVSEQILPIFYGPGNNGKNVLLDTVTGLMGGYAGQAPPDLLTLSKHREHPTEIADLWGRRLVVASETEEGCRLRIQLVKRLTGDARIKARFMRKDFFEFERTHKIVLVTNHPPVISENSEAIWRRIKLVPFTVVIPERERDPKLLQKLRTEWNGVLSWLVRGCQDWLTNGLVVPSSVTTATLKYRGRSDHFGRFLNECCVEGEGLWIPSATLHGCYEQWCRDCREHALPMPVLHDRLREHGYAAKKLRGARGWLGLEVKR